MRARLEHLRTCLQLLRHHELDRGGRRADRVVAVERRSIAARHRSAIIRAALLTHPNPAKSQRIICVS